MKQAHALLGYLRNNFVNSTAFAGIALLDFEARAIPSLSDLRTAR